VAKEIKDRKDYSTSRMRIVALGVVLGAVWGGVMWGIFTLVGQETSGRSLAYLIISTGMIGGGVAAIFGVNQVRQRGERVTPKFRMPFRKK
jgi:hypothetical protein